MIRKVVELQSNSGELKLEAEYEERRRGMGQGQLVGKMISVRRTAQAGPPKSSRASRSEVSDNKKARQVSRRDLQRRAP
jgi:hypothetical protein